MKPFYPISAYLRLAAFFTFLFLGFHSTLTAQSLTTYIEDWVAEEPAPLTETSNEFLQRVASVTDGSSNLYVAAAAFNDTTDVHDLLLTKYNYLGVQQWQKRFNLTGGGNVLVGAIALDGSTNVLITGAVLNGSNNYDALTIKYNSSGVKQWHALYNGNANNYDGGTAIAADGSGNVYIVGVCTQTTTLMNYLTIKYTSAGSQSWASTYDGGYNLRDVAAKISYFTGTVTAWGTNQKNGTDWQMSRVTYNDANGSQISANVLSPSDVVVDQINGFTTDASGNFYVVGAIEDDTTQLDFMTVKLNSSLAVQWIAYKDGGSNRDDVAKAVAVDGSGNVYVTGYATLANRDYLTVKYNSSGSEQWAEFYNGDADGHDQGSDIAIDAYGKVFITGYSNEVGNTDYHTFMLDPSDGDVLWDAAFNSVYNRTDKAAVLRLDEQDGLLVTGRTMKIVSGVGEEAEVTTVRYKKADIIIPPDEEAQSSAIYYIKNNGQLLNTDQDSVPEIKFYSHSFPELYFFDDKTSLVLSRIDDDTATVDTMHRVDMMFAGGRERTVTALEEREDYYNYYLGHIPEGRERVPLFQRLVHVDIFDGIDLHYTSNAAGVKYDFVVKPGADPTDIRLIFDGQDDLNVVDSALVIETSIGDIVFAKMEALQIDGGEEEALGWTPVYQVAGDTAVTFGVGSFDGGKPVIIRIAVDPEVVECDPVDNTGILYSTYYGGSNADIAYDMTTAYKPLPGADFNDIFITGSTDSFEDFPVPDNSTLQLSGKKDAFVLRINGGTYSRNWVTFFGGSTNQFGQEGKGSTTAFAVAYSNNNSKIWFGGESNSTKLPVTTDDPPGVPDIFTGSIIAPPQAGKGFVARLKSNGVLEYATFFGSGDEVAIISRVNTMDVNSEGHVFFGGFSSTGLSTSELQDNGDVFYQNFEDDGESFITEFDADAQLIWSTEFGRVSSTLIDLDVDYEEDLIVTGLAQQITGTMLDFVDQPGIDDLSVTTPGGNLSSDVYIAKFDISTGRDLIWSTLFPGPSDEYPEEVKTDNDNEIFLMGSTLSEEFHEDIQETVVNTNSGCNDLFLAKFTHQGVLLKTRFLGGENEDGYNTFCVDLGATPGAEQITGGISFDIYDDVFVTTYTNSADFPDVPLSNAYNQTELGNGAVDDNGDAAIIALNNDLEDKWITYLGGQSGAFSQGDRMWESGGGIEVVFDKLFVTGSTTSACDIRIPLKDAGSTSNQAIHYFEHLNSNAMPVNQKITDFFITVFDLGPLNITGSNEGTARVENFFVFPQPADDFFSIVPFGISEQVEVKLFDIIGKVVFSDGFLSGANIPIRVPVNNLPNGVYHVTLTSKDNIVSGNIVVQHR